MYLSFDEQGRPFGYNFYDRLQTDLKLDDDDFNPDKLWGTAKALKDIPRETAILTGLVPAPAKPSVSVTSSFEIVYDRHSIAQ